MRNKGFIILLAVCGLVVMLATIFMTSTNNVENDLLVDQFYNVTQGYNTIQVERVVKDKNNKAPGDVETPDSTVHVQTWLDACIAAHHLFGHSKAVFDPKGTVNVNGDFVTTDSYGWLGLAAMLYGVQDTVDSLSQQAASNNSKLKLISISSEADLQYGDILFFRSNVEVLGSIDNGTMSTITWSSDATAQNIYTNDTLTQHTTADCSATVSVKSSYKVSDIQAVYRVGAGGGSTQPTHVPTPTPNPNPVPTPNNGKVLNMPIYIQQGGDPATYSSWYLNQSKSNPNTHSKKTVGSSGCFYCSIYMVSCYFLNQVIPMENAVPSFRDGLYTDNGPYHSGGGASLYAGDALKYFGTNKTITQAVKQPQVSDVTAQIDNNMPVIYRVNASGKTITTSSTHYVVIMGYDNDKQVFYVYDPGTQKSGVPRELPYADFDESVKDSGCYVQYLK